MLGPSRRRFTRQIDSDRVKRAIEAAEGETSGEIVVSVSRFFWGSVQKTAERTFDRLGVARTRERNGVLIFIVPSRRQFVILGDAGIHERVGQEFWVKIASAVSQRFRQGDMTGALVDGIEQIGRELRAHFPHRGASDQDELPNEPDV